MCIPGDIRTYRHCPNSALNVHIQIGTDSSLQSVDVKDISICHTGFWAAVRDHGWSEAAKRFIHPDPEDVENEQWQAYKHTRGHLKSKMLLIPCNFPGKSAVEVGHWILAIRERVENGNNKLHILDSLGKESGRRHKDTIANKLANTPFFKGFPKGKIYDVVKQSECECGARVAKYMEDITSNYKIMSGTANISRILGKTVNWEKNNGKYEVAKCRIRVKNKLEGYKANT